MPWKWRRAITFASRGVASLGLVLVMLPITPLVAREAVAQQNTARVIQGKVLGANGQPLPGAVVYLKNTNSLTMKTYITDAEGNYRFGQISNSSDFQVWAEVDSKKSPVKSISSFDSKAQFTINLHMK